MQNLRLRRKRRARAERRQYNHRTRRIRRDMRRVGQRQEHAAQPAGRDRPAQQRARDYRRHRHYPQNRGAIGRVQTAAHRVCISVFQHHTCADRRGEHRRAADAGRQTPGQARDRRGAEADRTFRQAQQAPQSALGRPAAARRHRARNDTQARADTGRRAYRQSGQPHQPRDSGTDAPERERKRPDAGADNARPAGCRAGRPRDTHMRRPRRGARKVAARAGGRIRQQLQCRRRRLGADFG